MKKLFAFLPIALLIGCDIGMKVTTLQRQPSIASYEPFALVEENEPFDTARYSLVARVRTADKGMTVRCDYPTVLDTVTHLARSLGANLVKIDRHFLPNTYGSSCHRVEARLYRADDATPFEQSIVWYPERRLRVSDFRGDTAARPFRAASFCGITYHGNYVGRRIILIVEANFDHKGSYFKHGDDDLNVLSHEQVHFDIAEVHARILRKRISETSFVGMDFNGLLQGLHMEVTREMMVEQDRYDAAVYADPGLQSSWSDSVATKLAGSEQFRSHAIVVQIR